MAAWVVLLVELGGIAFGDPFREPSAVALGSCRLGDQFIPVVWAETAGHPGPAADAAVKATDGIGAIPPSERRERSMQLVRLPAWLYILIGLVLIVIGLAGGRLPVAVIGVVAIIAGVVRVVWSRG